MAMLVALCATLGLGLPAMPWQKAHGFTIGETVFYDGPTFSFKIKDNAVSPAYLEYHKKAAMIGSPVMPMMMRGTPGIVEGGDAEQVHFRAALFDLLLEVPPSQLSSEKPAAELDRYAIGALVFLGLIMAVFIGVAVYASPEDDEAFGEHLSVKVPPPDVAKKYLKAVQETSPSTPMDRFDEVKGKKAK